MSRTYLFYDDPLEAGALPRSIFLAGPTANGVTRTPWRAAALAAAGDPTSLPGVTTRAEVSRELARDSSRIVLGMPPGAPSGGHIRYHAHRAGAPIVETLEATLESALALVDTCA